MQFDDGKKVFEIVYSHMIRSNCYDLAVFTLKMTNPVTVEAKFDIHDIKEEKGITGIKFNKYSEVAKAYKFKGDVLLKMPDDALNFIHKIHDEKIEELTQAAQKDPERWFWAVGGDTHQIYLTPDNETGTSYRDDLRKVEDVLEKTLRWLDNPLNEVSTKVDRKTALYTETGWFEVSHADVMRIYNEIISEKEAKKSEAQTKEDAIFQKAKETGVKQLLERYSIECSDPHEECDIDIVTVYAMPDGTTKRTQTHTW
jgi:hypothetical protein